MRPSSAATSWRRPPVGPWPWLRRACRRCTGSSRGSPAGSPSASASPAGRPRSPRCSTATNAPARALGAGEEGAVPATKTFSAQLAALALVAEALGPVPWSEADWGRVPGAMETVLGDFTAAERAAERLDGADELVALGRGYLMP